MRTAGFLRIAYGVDLAAGHVRLVRCAKERRKGACETLYDGPPPVTGAAADRLREESKRLDVAVAGGLSPHVAFARWVHTPLNSVEKSLRVFPSLLDVQIPFAVEQCEVAVAQIRREENRAISILAVACRREDIRSALSEFEAAGIEPDMLDHEGLALWSQSLKEAPEPSTGPRVVAFIREDSVTLAVGEGAAMGGFLAAQRLRMGSKDFTDAVRGPAVRREFATKVRQMLLVHLPERIEPLALTWFWTGELAQTLRSELESELRTVGPPKFCLHEQPETFLARALATRALVGESAGSHLLRGRLTPPKEKRRWTRLHHRLAAAMAVAGVSLAISGAVLRWAAVAQSRELEQRIAALAQDLSGLARVPRGQEVLIAQRALAERASTDVVWRRCARDDIAEGVVAFVKKCAERQTQLEWLSWREDALSVRGSFKDWNDGEVFVQGLEIDGFTVNLSRQDAGADGRVPFTLHASKTPAEGPR